VSWGLLYYAEEITNNTNTMNKDKIEILEEKKKAIQNEIDELSKERIDFSEFVGRYGKTLVIK
jgi:prefoldin subunit 5